MRSRTLIASLLVVAAVSACGDEDGVTAETGAPPGIAHPAGDDEAVVRLELVGGFLPEGADASGVPEVVITGDGTVYRPGATTLVYPGPALLPVTRAELSEEGLQQVLAEADHAGLLADVEYPQPDTIADAATTLLRIWAGDDGLRHEAYALSEDETGRERQALARFVDQLRDLPTLAGSELGAEEVAEPDAVVVTARPERPEDSAALDPAIPRKVVMWPVEGVPIPAPGACTVVPFGTLAETLRDADGLTRYEQGGTTHLVWFRPALPGDDCLAEATS